MSFCAFQFFQQDRWGSESLLGCHIRHKALRVQQYSNRNQVAAEEFFSKLAVPHCIIGGTGGEVRGLHVMFANASTPHLLFTPSADPYYL